jgi:S1-C subfamily serine protease
MNTIRLPIFFALVLCFSGQACATNWQLIFDISKRKDYLDFDNVRKETPSFFSRGDPDVLLETKTLYLEPLVVRGGPYSSSLDSWAIKCVDRTIARTAASVFGLNGQQANEWRWGKEYKEIGNDAIRKKLVDYACDKLDPTVAERDAYVADWVTIKSDESRKYQIDAKSVRKEGSAWLSIERTTFSEDQSEQFGLYRAIVGRVYYDCDRKKVAYGSEGYWDAAGRRIKFFETKFSELEWKEIENHSFDKARYKLVCRTDLNSSTSQEISQPKKARGSGSGFIVDKSGSVVTNRHVVTNCTEISVTHDEKKYSAVVGAADERLDLAVLKTKISSPGASIRRDSSITGQIVFAAGFPLSGLLSKDMNFTPGMISATSGIGGDVTRLQVTTPIQPGNSGGPLLDESAAVSGVIVSKLDAVAIANRTGDIPQNVNFAVKSDILRLFLDSNRIKYEQGNGIAKAGSEVAAKARLFTVQVFCD